MRVTAEILRSRHACEDQVLLFERVTGDAGEIDLFGVALEAWCVAHATCFDWFWCAQHLLPIPVFQVWLDEDHKQAAEVYMKAQHRNQHTAWRRYKLATARAFVRRAEGCPDPTVLKAVLPRQYDTVQEAYYRLGRCHYSDHKLGVTSYLNQEDET